LNEEHVLADATRAEREIQRGQYRGPLHGVPFSVKDNLATCGVRTTAGSKILADWVPEFDETAVQRLKDAGAVLLGKTNMHEWALGGTTINPFYGTTRNPWNLDCIAGGSSGGSAAAVARIYASLRSAPTARNRCAILLPCAASSALNLPTAG
jgi:aspartyl-tRNA(Asn)/glutamyl-tRNA(Gln) amidotransferase subunit A